MPTCRDGLAAGLQVRPATIWLTSSRPDQAMQAWIPPGPAAAKASRLLWIAGRRGRAGGRQTFGFRAGEAPWQSAQLFPRAETVRPSRNRPEAREEDRGERRPLPAP
jgi:hypothetical protein